MEKIRGIDSINTIGVLGAGIMGRGIAQVAAQAGCRVVIYDIADTVLQEALQTINHFLSRSVDKGRMSKDDANAVSRRLAATTELEDLAGCDFVIEAVPEVLDLKLRIFGDLDQVTRPDVILATNTSTFSVTKIASGTSRPDRVVGMHFFNPAPLMPLVEVIAGSITGEAVVQVTTNLALKMGKTPVRSKDTPGFIVNRVARPFYLEGLRLLSDGVADHALIDRLLREGGGFRMGPFQLMDLIGLDVNFAASQSVYEAFFHAPRFRPSIYQQRMVEGGRLGRKSGRGWYDYGEERA